MMGRSHIATGTTTTAGLLASSGAIVEWVTPTFDGYPAHVWATCLILGSGASLLPDIDTSTSTAYHHLGPLSRSAGKDAQRLARWIYLRSAAARDPARPRVHRGWWHTAACAALVGLLAGVLAAVFPPALAPLLLSCSVLTLRGLNPSLPNTWLRFLYPSADARNPLQYLYAGVATWVLLWIPDWSPWAGVLVAAAVTLGMVTHDLGDACTNTAVPLLFPAPIRGQRWRLLGTPRVLRFNTGSPVENGIRRVSLLVTVVVLAVGVWLPPADVLGGQREATPGIDQTR